MRKISVGIRVAVAVIGDIHIETTTKRRPIPSMMVNAVLAIAVRVLGGNSGRVGQRKYDGSALRRETSRRRPRTRCPPTEQVSVR